MLLLWVVCCKLKLLFKNTKARNLHSVENENTQRIDNDTGITKARKLQRTEASNLQRTKLLEDPLKELVNAVKKLTSMSSLYGLVSFIYTIFSTLVSAMYLVLYLREPHIMWPTDWLNNEYLKITISYHNSFSEYYCSH